MNNKQRNILTIYKNKNMYDKSNVDYTENKIFKYDKNLNNSGMNFIDYGLSLLKKDEIMPILNRKQNNDLLSRSPRVNVGIDFPVSIVVEQMPNDRGRMVPHMVAKWRETTATPDGYDEMPTSKCEEMGRYFNAELFVNGIIQRAAWIKADHSDCVAYLNDNPFAHPALYKAA